MQQVVHDFWKVVETSSLGYIPVRLPRTIVGFNKPPRRSSLFPCIKCEKKDDDEAIRKFRSNPYPLSGRVEPLSGTCNRARAARAPEPTGESEGSPSFGKRPGSRRKKYKTSAAASESSNMNDAASSKLNLDDREPSGTSVAASTKSSESSLDAREPESFDISVKSSEHVGGESSKDATEEPKDILSEYVVYQTEEKLSGYDQDRAVGRPHPFINPK